MALRLEAGKAEVTLVAGLHELKLVRHGTQVEVWSRALSRCGLGLVEASKAELKGLLVVHLGELLRRDLFIISLLVGEGWHLSFRCLAFALIFGLRLGESDPF